MLKIRQVLLCLLLVVASIANAQSKKVSGQVTSEGDGEPMPGVSILVKGTDGGAITDNDGNFEVTVTDNDAVLVFTFIGMQTKEVTVGTATKLNIAMTSTSLNMDEIMVVAYGTSTKEAFTGSASVVGKEQLEKRQSSSVTDALAGITPGIQVTSNSGQPGSGSSIRIRGIGSANASSAPLYVVDGIPYSEDLSAISNQDIESITVLKDAASSALYGARGANGVILITTKKGKMGETKVNFEARVGVNQRGVPEYDIMTSPSMYYEKYYQGVTNNQYGLGTSLTAAENQSVNTVMLDALGYDIYSRPAGESLVGVDGKLNPNATLGTVYNGQNYLTNDDWYDELFGENNLRQEYSLSISNASAKQNTYFSMNYLKDEGIISNSNFNRLTSRIKTDYQVKDWLKVGGNIAYTNYTNNYPSDQTGLSSKNIFYVGRIVAPIYPMYVRDANGDIIVDTQGHTLYDYGTNNSAPGLNRPVMSIANPASDLSLDRQQTKADVLTTRGFADFDLYKGLKFSLTAGYDVTNQRYSDKSNAYYGQSANYGGSVYKSGTHYQSLVLQQLLTYEKEIGDHSFDVLVGHETFDRQWGTMYGSKQNLYNPESEEISGAILKPSTGSSSNAYFIEGYLSRLQYNYQDKYFASASFRRDGSSRFAPGNEWGNFWSVGGSWLINEESFMNNVSFVDFLKFKASYGVQGNDAILDKLGYNNYQPYMDQYEVKNSNDDFATELSYKGNPDITWETSHNFNVGFEFTVLNNILDGSVEFFNRRVEDMLYNVPVPSSAGYSSFPDNVGSMKNTGIEFSLNANIIKTSTLDWDIYVNGTHYKNEILELPEQFSDPEGYVTGRRILKVGGSIYDMWYPISAGIDQTTGEAQWRIDNGDGTYGTTKDYSVASLKANSANLGSSLPDFQGGFGTSLDAFGFDFSVSCSFSIGGQIRDYAYQQLMHSGGSGDAGQNWHKDILNSWTPENTNTDIPAVDYGAKDYNSNSDRFVIDASYLSLDNITLGYTLPKSVVENIKLGSVRVYAVADNIALKSKRKGLDPRQSLGGDSEFIYSPIRTISLGAKVSF